MRRPAFYSRSPRTLPPAAEPAAGSPADAAAVADAVQATPPPVRARWQPGRRAFALLTVSCIAIAAGGAYWAPRQGAKALTQKDIDAAVLRTLQTNTLPSPAAKAADIVRPSIVRVVGYGPEKATPEATTQKRGRNMANGKPHEAPLDALRREHGFFSRVIGSGA